MSTPTKKKIDVEYKFKRGQYETDRKKISDWVLDNDVWLEIRDAGINSDGSEFVTITINNITKFPEPIKKSVLDQGLPKRF